ncbi:uncharacterized protein LOC123689933 [Pieris rapae]|uniref:uncharacterized protein LOC123689933 n=1 Tax=Pieris rapae TaxID=64459 RepID=UPI001E27C23D|nr:uncharacterized protein LOC123689933 [Pieris rapae]
MPVTRSQNGMQRGESTLTVTSATRSEVRTTGEEKTIEQSTSTSAPSHSEKALTLTPAGYTRRAASRTVSKASSRRLAEAREELARCELREAQAAAHLARLRLEAETEEGGSVIEDVNDDHEEKVANWMRLSAQKPEEIETKSDIRAIADAIKEVMTNHVMPQPKYIQELPIFEGDSSEWTAFRVVYEDTSPMFSDVQNMARLRKAIKGTARESIKSLLYSEAKPEEVINALRRRFGRPDALVLAELEKLKALPGTTENPRDICVFASQINNSVAAIKGLKKPQYLYSPEIVKIIIEKMPAILRFRWYDYTAAREEESFSDIQTISDFLNLEADKCGAFAVIEDSKSVRPSATIRRPAKQTTFNIAEKSRPEEIKCPVCEGNHKLKDCQGFLNATVNDRWETVKRLKVCFKCLVGKHRKEKCRRPPCKLCRRWHHSLLHVTSESEQCHEEAATETATVNTISAPKAILKMLKVEIYGPTGSKQVLALLDEGSTVTLLDENVAASIGIKGPRETLNIETIGGGQMKNHESMIVDIKVKGIRQGETSTLKRARTIKELKLTPQLVDKTRLRSTITCGIRRGKPGQPVASRTKLGWVIHGFDSNGGSPINYVNTCAHASVEEDKIDQLVREHFNIESLGVQPKKPSTDIEQRALEILERTSRQLEDGRYEVGLLWKSEDLQLPNNYTAALNRFQGIEKKLRKDAKLKNEYSAQIENLLKSNYAEEAPVDCRSNKKWYLPHFPVVHPLKKKLRIVFDAAAKYNGVSLNDVLLSGPDLLQSIFGVLLRFRQGPVAIAADIKEMFLQVKISEEDRDSLRFLWRKDKEEQVKEYRMSSVIFGAASSPCTAIYIKNKNAKAFSHKYPEAAQAIERNHYMDDYLQSFHSVDDCKRVMQQVDLIHKNAHFELRGWASNKKEIVEAGGEQEVHLGENEEKTLGLRWLTSEDCLGFRSQFRRIPDEIARGMQTPTKREVTGAVMSTFDPLGLLSPILIQGKKLIQKIWRSGVGWDDQITEDDTEAWKSYLEHVGKLKDIRLPRCMSPFCTEGELHTFTDASETAYAAAVYWRTRGNGKYLINLVAAKSRVTPLKPISMPRLELQAALLGARLADSVARELDLQVTRKTFWTDSSVVLSWIKADPRTFKTFVAHRIAEIEDLTKPQDWRWVPTAHNPADDATRSPPEEFNAEHRWFKGPDFLSKDEEEWPAPRSFKKEKSEEDKTTEQVNILRHSEITPVPENFSSWTRLWRSTARVLQFINLCKEKKLSKHECCNKSAKKRQFLPIGEIHLLRAEEVLIAQCQQNSFKQDIKNLMQGRKTENQSQLKRLDVTIKNKLIRLQGRAKTVAGIDNDYLTPIVLDGRSVIGRLIIKHYHEKYNHGNQATVMNEIRQKYWMLGLRSVLRSIQQNCQHCKLRKGKPSEHPAGNLPQERLRHGEPAFTCTGLDYFGPMLVAIGRRREKRWGALFTCLTTRAVHIEIVPSLTTDSTIMALRRFAARRGMPKVIYSDNGTNFVKANKEIQTAIAELKKEEVVTEAEKVGVQWKFIPPGAPNMGGAWERLVRSIKVALDVTLKERIPREEVLHTLLLEAEHMVNSRPITNLADNSEEEALTPNHFLIGRSSGAARIGHFPDAKLVGREDWKTVQRLSDHFWRRWLREYLPTLLPRKMTGRREGEQLQRGDVVLIVDRTLPRCTWPRGIIETTYPGPDGRTRIVDVATKGGVLRRPSSRIVILVPAKSPCRNDGATHEGENVGDS